MFVMCEKNSSRQVSVRERYFHLGARDRKVVREPESGGRALLPCPMAHATRHARAVSRARAIAARTPKSFRALGPYSFATRSRVVLLLVQLLVPRRAPTRRLPLPALCSYPSATRARPLLAPVGARSRAVPVLLLFRLLGRALVPHNATLHARHAPCAMAREHERAHGPHGQFLRKKILLSMRLQSAAAAEARRRARRRRRRRARSCRRTRRRDECWRHSSRHVADHRAGRAVADRRGLGRERARQARAERDERDGRDGLLEKRAVVEQ